MSFDAFRRYLTDAHRSAATGQPLGPHAAGDYPSRLRRLEIVLRVQLQDAPPMVLRSLASGLRQDARVTAVVPMKVIGDIAVALRAYAGFLDNPSSAAGEQTSVGPSLDPNIIIGELKEIGFAVSPTGSKKIVELRRDDLTVYVRLDSREPIIVHPVFEECYTLLVNATQVIHTVGVRFYHHSSLVRFPTRDNGRGLIHYGIQFGLADTEVLRRFIDALQNALTAISPLAADKTLGDEIHEVDTELTVLSKARKGQGRFRADLLNFWQGQCAMTGVRSPELLRASHIKPWSVSTNPERLDPFNGLLLAVHLDALFDRALITFEDSGEMLASRTLSDHERDVFGLTSPTRNLLLSVAHLGYMRHHRDRFVAGER